MAKKTITDAVASRLAANFALATILDLNDDMLPPDGNIPWVRLEFVTAENMQTTLRTRYREMGAFRIVVATEVMSGLSKSMTWCETIATIFRNQYFEGVYCKTPTIREGIHDGSYFIASVIVPYRYEYSD